MNDIICAIEQEIKYTRDSSGQGSSQYRAGYQQALEIVTEFLAIPTMGRSARTSISHNAVQRLLSFAPPPSPDKSLDGHLDESLTELERNSLGIALGVLRGGQDNADYLNWWLNTYVTETSLALFPDWPQPSTEEELDQLERQFDERFGSMFGHIC